MTQTHYALKRDGRIVPCSCWHASHGREVRLSEMNGRMWHCTMCPEQGSYTDIQSMRALYPVFAAHAIRHRWWFRWFGWFYLRLWL